MSISFIMSKAKPFLSQNHERRDELAEIFRSLDKYLNTEQKANNRAIYIEQREMIDKLFSEQKEGAERRLLLLTRLSLLDALYSTGVNRYHPYAVVDIAEAIDKLGTDDEYVATLATWLDNLDDQQSKALELFNRRFGDLTDNSEEKKEKWEKGTCAISLLSKYSYYLFRQYKDKYPSGFPIYDSLAKESYARVLAYMGEEAKTCPKGVGCSIVSFLKAIKALGLALWGSDEEYMKYEYSMQRFDLLDTYLWRLGKLNKASYSLLLPRGDFEKIKEFQQEKNNKSLTPILSQIDDELFKTIYQHHENIQKDECEKNKTLIPS